MKESKKNTACLLSLGRPHWLKKLVSGLSKLLTCNTWRLALRQELRKHDLGPFPMLGAWLYAIVVALGVIFPVVLMPGGLLSHVRFRAKLLK